MLRIHTSIQVDILLAGTQHPNLTLALGTENTMHTSTSMRICGYDDTSAAYADHDTTAIDWEIDSQLQASESVDTHNDFDLRFLWTSSPSPPRRRTHWAAEEHDDHALLDAYSDGGGALTASGSESDSLDCFAPNQAQHPSAYTYSRCASSRHASIASSLRPRDVDDDSQTPTMPRGTSFQEGSESASERRAREYEYYKAIIDEALSPLPPRALFNTSASTTTSCGLELVPNPPPTPMSAMPPHVTLWDASAERARRLDRARATVASWRELPSHSSEVLDLSGLDSSESLSPSPSRGIAPRELGHPPLPLAPPPRLRVGSGTDSSSSASASEPTETPTERLRLLLALRPGPASDPETAAFKEELMAGARERRVRRQEEGMGSVVDEIGSELRPLEQVKALLARFERLPAEEERAPERRQRLAV
ncbi:hypothetical protein C8Q76DRAFT_708822 [Earliella scabrosa]|nr:hypothetical protein C8Q76DRAFT_708822 [Earliella scabrosa]